MYRKYYSVTVLFVFLFLFTSDLFSQNNKTPSLTRVLFILDGSGTMLQKWESDTRINIARKLMNRILDSLKTMPGVEVALRVYGHRSPNTDLNCKDSHLEVAFEKNNHEKIKAKIKSLTPQGTTPIAYSLEQSANDFPEDPESRNVIILITDGLESCKGDPCSVSRTLQEKGISIKPFIVGIGIGENNRSLMECAGHFIDMETEDEIYPMIDVIISYSLNPTTAQVNLLDHSSKPTESDVEMTFLNQVTGKIKYRFTHTINHRGVPDTIPIDPVVTYRLVIHTLPPVTKDNISLIPSKHNIIPVDVPQGFLEFKIQGVTNYINLKGIIRNLQTGEIINIQEANTKEKYLTGTYRLEILTLPVITKEVKIKPDYTTTINIQQPGILTINGTAKGPSAIFQLNEIGRTLVTRVDNLPGMLVMQPGKYQLQFRNNVSKNVILTQIHDFEIQSGIATSIKIR